MFQSFTGRKLCKWNAEKRRTVMPSDLKENLVGEGLGEKLVIVKSIYNKCLNVYSEAEWDKHVEKLREMPQKTQESIWAVGYYVSGAVTCDMDAQGRFVLPKDDLSHALGEAGLLEYAGIADVEEVLIIGNVNHAEIWSVPNWKAANERTRMGASAKTNDDAVSASLGTQFDYAY